MKNLSRLSLMLMTLMFMGAGCVSFSSDNTNAAGDGGVFKSTTRGDEWVQKVAIPTTSADIKTIGTVAVVAMHQDPQDANALYIGTAEHGLWYTYDGGDSWRQPKQLRRGRVNDVAVSPKNKCEMYVTVENKILKSIDCARSFTTTYLDSRTDKVMSQVEVDFFNPQVVWIANTSGDVLKSSDHGQSWTPVTEFKSNVRRLSFHPDDSRRLYVGTSQSGVWRTDDAGANWIDLGENYKKDFRDSQHLYDMAIGVNDPNVIVLATKYGLIRSNDRGDSWETIDLLTPEGTTLIYSVAIDPKDANNLYYGTSTTFYRSPNGGVNWVPKSLPTTRAATVLLVDRANPNTLYLGVTRIKK